MLYCPNMRRSTKKRVSSSRQQFVHPIVIATFHSLQNKLSSVLETKYGITTKELSKNDDSTEKNVYIANTDTEKYVIKTYSNIEKAKAISSISKLLSDQSQKVPKVLPTKNHFNHANINPNEYIVVYSFMDGVPIGWGNQTKKLSPEITTPLARMLASIHSSTQGENEYHLPIVPIKYAEELTRKSALHYDLTRSNVFLDARRRNLVGIIDFDDAKYGSSIWDVAIAIGNLFISKTFGIDYVGIANFLGQYYANTANVAIIERPMIYHCIELWINAILSETEIDIPHKASFIARKKLILTNSEKLRSAITTYL